jgi:hypothetical protein
VEESTAEVPPPADLGLETDAVDAVSADETGISEPGTEALPETPAEEVQAGEEPGAEEAPADPGQAEDPAQGQEMPDDAGVPDIGQEPEPGEVEPPHQEPPVPGASDTTEPEQAANGKSDPDPQSDGTPPDSPPAGSESASTGPPLSIPAGAVSAGSTQFLNGGWRTSSSLQDPRTALPVDMEYRLEDGSGRLDLRRSDGSVCSGQVQAVLQDGKLVIQNARDIVCPDGTNFGRPRLECVPGKDGRADCSGRYETGEDFSVDIKKAE